MAHNILHKNMIVHELTNSELMKIKAAVLYILSKCGSIDFIHLFKILYFADKKHYSQYGQRIINDTYCALQNGPVPTTIYDAIKVATKKASYLKNSNLKILADVLCQTDNDIDYIISAKENPDLGELSSSNIECLDQSIEENKNLSFDELSNKSHDAAWQKAWDKRNASPMNNIDIAIASDSNEDMLEYIKENELIDSLIC